MDVLKICHALIYAGSRESNTGRSAKVAKEYECHPEYEVSRIVFAWENIYSRKIQKQFRGFKI